MRNAFYNNFQTMKKTWTKDNYELRSLFLNNLQYSRSSWSSRNCQHFMKVLYERSTGKKLPADIRKFVYFHDWYKFGKHEKA